MFVSSKYSYLAIRIGIAAVFLWFGIDKFRNTNFWEGAWLSSTTLSIIGYLGLSGIRFLYIVGIFEILAGLSFLSGILIRFFSALATIFLIAIIATNGLGGVTVRDLGLIGCALAIFFWPINRNRF